MLSAWEARGTHPVTKAVMLTHLLCARITEVLSLQTSDIHFDERTVRVRALKRQQEANKPMSVACENELRRLQAEGISVRRTRLSEHVVAHK